MIHYTTLIRDMCDIRDKIYFYPINLEYSFFMLISVAPRPMRIATCSHVIPSKIRYRIIRCIRTGIVLIHTSTSCLIRAAFRRRSFNTSSRRSSAPGSCIDAYASPSIRYVCIVYGKSCDEPLTTSCSCRFFALLIFSSSAFVSLTWAQASMYCSNIRLSNGTTSLYFPTRTLTARSHPRPDDPPGSLAASSQRITLSDSPAPVP